jgi:pimeloyl-ACP methyl ester carboxylesterase
MTEPPSQRLDGARTILFLHGFVSSAQSTKASYLADRFSTLNGVAFHALDFNPTPRDFEYMTTTGQIDRVRQYVLDRQLGPMSLIGSSYGGLIAVHYAHRFGGVERMLLLAPGLHWLSGGLSEPQLAAWKEAGALPIFHPAFDREVPVRYGMQADGLRYLDFVPPACPVTIIHGHRDDTVPIADSRAYAAEHPDQVQLVEVDADHDLNGHLDLVWEHVRSFLLAA